MTVNTEVVKYYTVYTNYLQFIMKPFDVFMVESVTSKHVQ